MPVTAARFLCTCADGSLFITQSQQRRRLQNSRYAAGRTEENFGKLFGASNAIKHTDIKLFIERISFPPTHFSVLFLTFFLFYKRFIDFVCKTDKLKPFLQPLNKHTYYIFKVSSINKWSQSKWRAALLLPSHLS